MAAKRVVPVVQFDLTVVAGRGLPAKDRNILGIRTSSDPYVEIRFWPKGSDYAGFDEGDPVYIGKTHTIMHNLNPQWNSMCDVLTVPADQMSEDAEFQLTVYDYDVTTEDDLIGTVYIPIHQASKDGWYYVWTPKGGSAGQVQCHWTMKKHLGRPEITIEPPLAHVDTDCSSPRSIREYLMELPSR